MGTVYHRLRSRAIAQRDRIPAPVRLLLRRARSARSTRSRLPVISAERATGALIPPRGLRERNAVETVDYWWTAVEGSERPLHDLLAGMDHKVEDFERVLDFGCGAGKVICALRGRGIELHGCDIHEPSIRWLKDTYPDLNLVVNPFDPPISYEDDTFDLIWAWSVITHLDPQRQRAWMGEWARIAAPGGLVLATFNSPALAERWAGESRVPQGVAKRTEDEGVVFLRTELDGNFTADFTGTTEAYGDTFNAPESIHGLAADAGLEVVQIVREAFWGQQHCAIMRAPAA